MIRCPISASRLVRSSAVRGAAIAPAGEAGGPDGTQPGLRILLAEDGLVNQRVAEGVAQLKRADPRALVETAGYAAACAGNSGAWGLYHLWRVPCGREDTKMAFFLKAGGWYDKRTALRESAPGLWLRKHIRTMRSRLPGCSPPKPR